MEQSNKDICPMDQKGTQVVLKEVCRTMSGMAHSRLHSGKTMQRTLLKWPEISDYRFVPRPPLPPFFVPQLHLFFMLLNFKDYVS